MTTIDQRILIPAGPDAVWDVLKDINKNPHWQTDCQEVSFLSSKRDGPGLRWRYANAQGNEYVVEVSAWYDGLGYEYSYIDGAPFRESRGRIRLQEIPEGTIIQWSLNYEIGGVLSGVRDVNTRRQFEKTMVDSLKALYSYIKKSGTARDVQEAKSLLRDALDYEARSQYVPRHPSRYSEEKEETAGTEMGIIEPPLADDDTRPNPTLADVKPEGEEEIAIRQPVKMEPTPLPPEPVPEAEETTADEAEPELEAEPAGQEAHARFKPPEPGETEQPAQESVVSPAPEVDVQVETEQESITPEQQPTPAPEPAQRVDPYAPILDTSHMDTKEISIWQVFGVERPSDTQPIQAITEAEAQAPEPEPPVSEVSAPPATIPKVEPPAVDVVEAVEAVVQPTPTPAAAVTHKIEPATKAALREPVQPLPHGFRLYARRMLVKLRRRA